MGIIQIFGGTLSNSGKYKQSTSGNARDLHVSHERTVFFKSITTFIQTWYVLRRADSMQLLVKDQRVCAYEMVKHEDPRRSSEKNQACSDKTQIFQYTKSTLVELEVCSKSDSQRNRILLKLNLWRSLIQWACIWGCNPRCEWSWMSPGDEPNRWTCPILAA